MTLQRRERRWWDELVEFGIHCWFNEKRLWEMSVSMLLMFRNDIGKILIGFPVKYCSLENIENSFLYTGCDCEIDATRYQALEWLYTIVFHCQHHTRLISLTKRVCRGLYGLSLYRIQKFLPFVATRALSFQACDTNILTQDCTSLSIVSNDPLSSSNQLDHDPKKARTPSTCIKAQHGYVSSG